MLKFMRILMASLFAGLLGTAALAPVQAAGLPIGAATNLDRASAPVTTDVQYRHRGYRPVRVYRGPRVVRHYHAPRRPVYRRAYPGPHFYYGAPVVQPVYVGRRCVIKRRWVWTNYGRVLRKVRVCRW